MQAIFFPSVASLEKWLEEHYDKTGGIWCIYYKPTTKKSDMSWPTLVETCLRYGWIDSLPGKVDDERTKHRINPRNPKSRWSRRNKAIIERLEKEGKMHENGKKLVEIARISGTWNALDDVERGIIPEDFQKFLIQEKAIEKWGALSKSKKRGFLEQLLDAKKPETRMRKFHSLFGAKSL